MLPRSLYGVTTMKTSERAAWRILLLVLMCGALGLSTWGIARQAPPSGESSTSPSATEQAVKGPSQLSTATVRGAIDVRAPATFPWRVVLRDSRASADALMSVEGTGPRRIEVSRLVPSVMYYVEVVAYHGARREVSHTAQADPKKNELTVELMAGWSLLCTVETGNRNPLAKAPVVLTVPPGVAPPDGWSQSDSIRVATDERGQAEIVNLLPRSPVDLACVAESYQVHRARIPGGASAERVTHHVILAPAGRLVGRLLLADGQPAQGVGLTAEGIAREEAGSVEWRLDAELRTDAEGRFECDCLSPGKTKVVGTPIYEPGQTTIVQFGATIAAGQTTDVGDVVVGRNIIDLQFEAPEGGTPKGVRVRAVLVPASGEDVAVAPASVVICYVYADEKGRAVLRGLPPGHLDLLCLSSDAAGNRQPTRLTREYSGYWQEHVRLEPLIVPPAAEVGVVTKGPKPGAILLVFDKNRFISARTIHRADENLSSDPGLGGISSPVTVLFINDGRFARAVLSVEDMRTRRLELDASETGGEIHVQAPTGLGPGRVAILLGLPGQLIDDFVTIGFADDAGRFQLHGLPEDVEWQVGARLGSRLTRPETVRFGGGLATIQLAE